MDETFYHAFQTYQRQKGNTDFKWPLKPHQKIQALELGAKSGAIMFSLLFHTSHWLQPLGVAFFKSLKTYYYQQINQWMRANFGMPV